MDSGELSFVFFKYIGTLIGTLFDKKINNSIKVQSDKILLINFYEYLTILMFQTFVLLVVKYEKIFNKKYFLKISLYLLIFILIDNIIINNICNKDISYKGDIKNYNNQIYQKFKENKSLYSFIRINFSYAIVELIFKDIIFFNDIILLLITFIINFYTNKFFI